MNFNTIMEHNIVVYYIKRFKKIYELNFSVKK